MTSQRTILITGCSDHSLGAALALAFHRAGGWRVFASARNPAKLQQVTAAGIATVPLDVASEESIRASVSAVEKLTGGGPLDALVNNAGAGFPLPILDADLGEARRLFDLNVFAAIRVTRAYVPLLLRSEAAGGRFAHQPHVDGVPDGRDRALPRHLQRVQGGAGQPDRGPAARAGAVRHAGRQPGDGRRQVDLLFRQLAPATLPPGSLYNVAKDEVEKSMSDEHTAADGTEASAWAEAVVRDLSSHKNPPHWVWRGRHATEVRLASHLPVGATDGIMRKVSGLDAVEQKIKEKGWKQE
ncbi:IBR finger domain protein [Apiospora saccharicola]